MPLDLLQDHAVALFLHVVRAGAFVAVVPLFGRQADSFMLRLVLSLALGGMFWWVSHQHVEAPDDLLTLGVLTLRESVVGIALGFALSTMTSLLVSAGELISSEMGFSMARAINPESGVDAAVVSQLLQVIGFLLILQFDLHHDALRVLEQTYRACPIGETYDITPLWEGLRALVSGSVELAVQYAFPTMGIMLLLSVAMVVLGRAVPSINLMEFGFALRVVVALATMAFFVVEGAPFLIHCFRGILDRSAEMFAS